MIGIMDKGIVMKWNFAFVAIITPINIITVIKKFRNSEITLPITKIYFGADVLLKIFLFPLIEFIDAVVDNEKKSKMIFPDKK